MIRRPIHLLWSVAFAAGASAHEVRPAYLQLRQTGVETYDVLWKVPGRGENLRLGLDPELPEECVDRSERRGLFATASFTQRWSIQRPGGLTGGTIRIAGLAATMTDVLVRLERLDGTTQVAMLTPASPAFVVEAAPNRRQVSATYLALGVKHILLGFDHLLYILAMLLMVKGWRRVVATLTAFTATHSLTLTAAALGWVHVPTAPIEACIALSILFVASEIVRDRQGHTSLTGRWPWVVAFTFGLLHGFGFAGALHEVGLPQTAIPLALLFFNVGVELGQLVFIAAFFVISAAAQRAIHRLRLPPLEPGPSKIVRFFPSYAIGSVAAFWVIQRVAAF